MPWAGIEPTFMRCVSLQNQSRSCFSRLSKESREFAAEVSSKTMFRARGTFLRGPAFTFAASKAESFGEASEKSDSVRAARAAVFVTSASLLELKTSTQGRSTCKVSSRLAPTTTSEWQSNWEARTNLPNGENYLVVLLIFLWQSWYWKMGRNLNRMLVTSVLAPLATASILEVQIDEKKSYSHVVDSLDLFCYVCLLSLTIVTLWVFKWVPC